MNIAKLFLRDFRNFAQLDLALASQSAAGEFDKLNLSDYNHSIGGDKHAYG